jgi:hypothetical protein
MYDINKYKCYGYDEKNEDGSIRCHCVVAISTYAGKPVKGYAKCHPDDTWDWEKGKALAIARCAEKIAHKRAKRAARKMAEAQDILNDAMLYLNDMGDYFANAMDEVAYTSAEVADLMKKM